MASSQFNPSQILALNSKEEVDYNYRKIQANSALPHDFKYCDKKNNIGIVEKKGLRETQEDAIDWGELPLATRNWSDKLWTIVLNKTIKQSDNFLKHFFPDIYAKQGSCLIANIVIPFPDGTFKIINICLGDSTTHLIQIKHNEIIRKNLHTIHNPKNEQDRLDSHNISKFRLRSEDKKYTLSVTRAIGDGKYEATGLIHTPTIKFVTVIGGQIFLVIACDGLTEKRELNRQKIGEILFANKDKSEDEIAEILVNAGLSVGSADNISTIVIKCNKQEFPFFAAIFDGHGGCDVAHFLRENFVKLLRFNINKQLYTKKNNSD